MPPTNWSTSFITFCAAGTAHGQEASQRHRRRLSTLTVAIELEGHCYSRLRQSEDFKEGVEAFNQKRPPKFIGR